MTLVVESDCIDRACRGDQVAMDRLLEQCWPEAYRVAFGILNDHESSRDAAQETCVAITTRLHQLREVTAFYGWFYRLVTREAVRLCERRPTLSLDVVRDAPATQLNDDHIDILAAVASLPPAHRAVVILHYYVGLNSTEIGRALGVASATVRFRVMLAKRRLRAALMDQPTVGSDGKVECNAL